MNKYAKLVLLLTAGIVCLFAEEQYNEPYRPQFHFSPAKNWTNDPCGLVYAFGNYHLFFQHNPIANVWGHMSWGHAISPNLVEWKQLPVAIPEGSDAAIFTGSSVFDRQNTSGLCTSNHGCIVSIYTGFMPKTKSSPERQTQNLAYSQDGRTWTKYSGNPVLDLGRSDSRDPRVFWYEPTKQWILIMVLANDKKVRLFSSRNLEDWHQLSDFGPQGATGGVWECPDLYDLPIEGQPGQSGWILKVGLNPGHIAGGSGGQYFIGHFDGSRFRNDNPPGQQHWLDFGRDNYCALTFGNDPSPTMIGWMNNWQYAADMPTTPWRGSMTLPRSLHLAEIDGALKLLQDPIRALQSLRRDGFTYAGLSETDLNQKLAGWPHRSQTFELQATVQTGAAKQIAWELLQGGADKVIVGFDAVKQELFVDRSHLANDHFNQAFPSRTVAPLQLKGQPLKLHIYVDRSSIEAFAQDGQIAMTNLVFPKPDSVGLSFHASGGEVQNLQVNVWKLASIWEKATR